MINSEEAEAYINAATAELGPSCGDEWAEECAKILRDAAKKKGVRRSRRRPPEYYRPTSRAIDPPLALPSADDNQNSAGN